MKHMILSLVFIAAAAWVFVPGARLIAAEKYFISGLIIKAIGGWLLIMAGMMFVLGATAF